MSRANHSLDLKPTGKTVEGAKALSCQAAASKPKGFTEFLWRWVGQNPSWNLVTNYKFE